jgi:hypothetical protein
VSGWREFIVTFLVGGALLFAAFAIGSWLEQGGKSKDEDYDDD